MMHQERFEKIIGRDKVISGAEALAEYAGDMSFTHGARPACILKPANADEVQSIVKLAREIATPLVPVSSGGPHFRGDTVPATGGAVIVDLSTMKKIIKVDRKNRVAMFEPGVTFGELIAAAAKEGLRLNMPLSPRKTKSVAGSLLEREPVIMPKYQWDIADPLGCLEVIFGTGDMFRTGAAAGSGSIEEQWAAGGAQKEAAGPSAASWYRIVQGAQGTMGIVTWASARCELVPKLEGPYFAGSESPEKLLQAVHWLVRLRLVNECFILNNADFSALSGKKTNTHWVLFFNVAAYDYFPDERMKGQLEDIGKVLKQAGLQSAGSISGVKAADFLEIVRNPSKDAYWKFQPKGNCEDIFFLTTFNKISDMNSAVQKLAEETGYPESGIGIYLQPLVQGSSCHVEYSLFYDPDDTAEKTRVKELSHKLTRELLAKGAFFSRPHGENTNMIMNRDAASARALKEIKAILDPDGIMNPGKLYF